MTDERSSITAANSNQKGGSDKITPVLNTAASDWPKSDAELMIEALGKIHTGGGRRPDPCK